MQAENQVILNVDSQTIGLETPLMKACESGNREIVIALLRAGCNPLLKDIQERTADTYAKLHHPNKDIHIFLR